MFSISCFEGSTSLTNIVIWTVVTFKFVYTYVCVFLLFGVVRGFFVRCLLRVLFVVYAMLIFCRYF